MRMRSVDLRGGFGDDIAVFGDGFEVDLEER